MENGNNNTNTQQQPQPSQHSQYTMLYYGLGVVAVAGFLLIGYNIIVLKCCVNRANRRRVSRNPALVMAAARSRGGCQGDAGRSVEDLTSFNYQEEEDVDVEAQQVEEGEGTGGGGLSGECSVAAPVRCRECAVCLSPFENGEEIKQMPRCKHCFHAPCIDMWLSSHLDCPICRSTL